jgi:drug/metabolite transporter (DMT)-like permease
MTFLLLSLSVILSTGRNLFSKKLSGIRFGTKDFYFSQSALFLCGGVALLLFGKTAWSAVSITTVGYAVIYGLLLILAQWFYTAALAKGNTALCSTVYSLGFILPTLSGAFFWSEPFSILDVLGVFCAVSAVIVSGAKPQAKKKAGSSSYYFIPLVIAMLASGGLGIVQKVQQKSDYSDQKSIFLLIAFSLAALTSLIFALFSKKDGGASILTSQKFAVASCIGVCFGCCNLLNTTLAGLLPSAIFFPTLNICVILLSMLSGLVFFKERLSRREVSVLILGGASILLLNLG